MDAENGVFVEPEVEQQSASMAVFRNMGDTALAPVSRINRRQAVAFEHNVARDVRGTHKAGKRFHQLRLTIAFNACDTDDFSGPHLEADVLDDSDALRRGHGQPAYRQHRPSRCCIRLVDVQQDIAPHHQPRNVGGGRVRGPQPADNLAVAHHRHLVGDRENLR